MALGTRRTPERDNPFLSGPVMERRAAIRPVLSGAGGTTAMTTAELLNGFLPVDCQDAHTWTFPTAAAIQAAIPGCAVGTSFTVEVINFGDATVTFAVNTGVTAAAIAGVSAVLTLVTLASKNFRFVCTAVGDEFTGTAAAWEVYGSGSHVAAVA